MYQTIHKATCDRCKFEYESAAHPAVYDWTDVRQESIGGDPYPYDPVLRHLCPSCTRLLREFMENEAIPVSVPGEEPMAVWERELLAGTPAGEVLDALTDILYPLDEYRDHQWNGGDVCEAVAGLLARFRPDASTRQMERPEEPAEGEHRHEWRWSNRLPGFDDNVTRRYCVDCGVLFSDL